MNYTFALMDDREFECDPVVWKVTLGHNSVFFEELHVQSNLQQIQGCAERHFLKGKLKKTEEFRKRP